MENENYYYDIEEKVSLPRKAKSITAQRQEEYVNKNRLAIATFVKKTNFSVQTYSLIRGQNYDPVNLLKAISRYSVLISEENSALKISTLLIKDDKIILNEREFFLCELYAYYLESVLGLSMGFKTLLENEDNAVSVKNVLYFFSRQDVQEHIFGFIFKKLVQLKENHRDKKKMAAYALKSVKNEIFRQIGSALLQNELYPRDLRYWLQFPKCVTSWTNILEYYHRYEKKYPESSVYHLPWLIVIKRRMKAIRDMDYSLLNNTSEFLTCINKLVAWLNHADRQNLVAWFWSFLFNENRGDTKRKFLYLHGPTNAGKSWFIRNLLASDEFKVGYRDFSFYGPDKGDQALHALVFDDPGTALGKNNQLSTSKILDLANTGRHCVHSLPAKYGYQRISHGQIIIASNQTPEQLFEETHLPALKTRLSMIEFSDYPLLMNSNHTIPFQYKTVDFIDSFEEEEENQSHISNVKKLVEDVFSYPNFQLESLSQEHPSQLRHLFSNLTPSNIIQREINVENDEPNQDLLEHLDQRQNRDDLHVNETRVLLEKCLNSNAPERTSSDLNSEMNKLNADIIFFLNWYAILLVLKKNCLHQQEGNILTNIPNKNFRVLGKNPQILSFYHIINELTEEQLCQMINM